MRVRLRAIPSGGPKRTALQVNRTGEGSIRGVSLARLGPALGHGFELDAKSLEQIAALADGAKARWTHGEMCADGIGTHLGRFSAPRLAADGLGVDADFTFSPTATHVQPEGLAVDARTFLLDAAEKEPDTLGLSVVLDGLTLEDLVGADGAPLLDALGEPRRAARVTGIPRADFTADPAANPAGLFAGAALAEGASSVLAGALEAHGAGKVRGYLRAWLAANPEPGMAPGAPAAPMPPAACAACADYHTAGHPPASAALAVEVTDLKALLATAERATTDLRGKLAAAEATLASLRAADVERGLRDDAAYVEGLALESVSLQAPLLEADLAEVRAQLKAGNRPAARAIGTALLAASRARAGKPIATTKPLAPPVQDEHQLSVIRGTAESMRAQGFTVVLSADGSRIESTIPPPAKLAAGARKG